MDEQTYTSLNWAFYEYDGIAWASADVYDYLDELEINLDNAISDSDVSGLLAWFGKSADDTATTKAGMVTEVVTYLIYDQTPIVDLEATDRLDISLANPTLVQEEVGFTNDNAITLSAENTNTLSMNGPTGIGSSLRSLTGQFFTTVNLKQSAFSYTLQDEQRVRAMGFSHQAARLSFPTVCL